jgi:pimeloyl-ACP methyl ester carboxylesterase
MAKIVCVHGIAQQFRGEETLSSRWAPSLRDGVRRVEPAGAAVAAALTDADVRSVFYGDLFRPAGQTLSTGEPPLTADDLTEFEEDLLFRWWREAAEVDPAVSLPGEGTMARTPNSVQAALRVLSGSAFFAGLAQRLMIGSLVQVRRYFTETGTRARIQRRVADAVEEDTRVVVAHSLGSVVAYEALCAHPEWPVRALVTLGSPLGVRNLVFDRLQPGPSAAADPAGQWPGAVTSWTNVADHGDVVALVKDLRSLFGKRVVQSVVHNGVKAHDVRGYLTARETGQGVLAGLAPA